MANLDLHKEPSAAQSNRLAGHFLLVNDSRSFAGFSCARSCTGPANRNGRVARVGKVNQPFELRTIHGRSPVCQTVSR